MEAVLLSYPCCIRGSEILPFSVSCHKSKPFKPSDDVAMDTAEGQVRERVAPAVLTGDDMVDLVSQPGSGLGELTVLAAMPSPPAHMLLRLRHRLALRLNSCSERRALDWRIISSLLTRRYSSSSARSSWVRSRQCQGFPRNPGRFHPGSGLSPSLDQLGAIEREASFLVK